jgi:hypothetical protein
VREEREIGERREIVSEREREREPVIKSKSSFKKHP